MPAPGEPPDGPDRQRGEVRLADPYELGAGVLPLGVRDRGRRPVLGINPFDQPDVQAAKDKTNEVLAGRRARRRAARLARRAARAGERGRLRLHPGVHRPGARERARSRSSSGRARRAASSRSGLGPRYLHSTGQLHKGGPNTGLFVQVVDDTGEELPIPGRDFGFGRLIRAQAAGDFAALKERGRRVVRVRLEDV